MTSQSLTRDHIASLYLDQLPFDPYPVQEESLLAWFSSEKGVLTCAPTGTGKTLIAEAALFEALHLGKRAYYTTPLIALTEQKLTEMQQSAVRWGFRADDIGLVTGNRRVNPDAPILVVVAEILFNRLLHQQDYAFDDVFAVVMDEFHSFNDPERGLVWEFSLGLLPPHIRLLLLSATVGNAYEFVSWLRRTHQRSLELVQSSDRKIPLTFHWVGDMLLTEQLESMADGDDSTRRIPSLVFCFNREECWNVAEQLKGKRLLQPGQQAQLTKELESHDWSQGAGPKLKQILQRGVGVHHAGVLPKYRRLVEDLFQRKLLSVCMCTETLAAGINLPARSVLLPSLMKGPAEKQKLIDSSSAHQMFGRAGRPQFDTQGHVFALAHEDDVKIMRWREKFDQIPENTKDPGLMKAKKALKKKMPTRRANQQYWTEAQFTKMTTSPPARLASRGPLPWRLLVYMLDASPDIEPIRQLVGTRLMDSKHLDAGQPQLDRMLLTLARAGYVELDPPPPPTPEPSNTPPEKGTEPNTLPYRPVRARPTENLAKLLHFRGVNPLYGVFLVGHLGIADRAERIQAMESILEIPASVGHFVRVPGPDEMPPGTLATTRLDIQLLQLGLATAEQLGAGELPDEDPRSRSFYEDERPRPLTLAEKLRMLFDYDFPGVHGVSTYSVWAAGELLEYGGDFNTYVTSKRLQKQEGIVFRHVLRLILLLREFESLCPPDTTPDEWQLDLDDISDRLTQCCRRVDPTSTDKALEQVAASTEF